jgi:hypothetical protein
MCCAVCVFCSRLICSLGLVASNNVLVAHSGETVVLHYIVPPQLNQTEGTIQCLSPKNSPMPTTPFSLKHPTYVLVNVNLSYSGMYRCWLSLEGWSEVNSSDMAYWFLHVTGELHCLVSQYEYTVLCLPCHLNSFRSIKWWVSIVYFIFFIGTTIFA